MKKELQEKLYRDFPELFQEKDLPVTKTCMCWGIECGDGWEPILRTMCNMIKYKGTRSLRLKSPVPFAYELYRWLESSTMLSKAFRWLERKLKLHSYTLRIKNPCSYSNFPGWGVRFTQIKEKFGTLRVYYVIYNQFKDEDLARFDSKQVAEEAERFSGYVDGVIAFAEHLSSKTCENDGRPGELSRAGWWKTICIECNGGKLPEEQDDE